MTTVEAQLNKIQNQLHGKGIAGDELLNKSLEEFLGTYGFKPTRKNFHMEMGDARVESGVDDKPIDIL